MRRVYVFLGILLAFFFAPLLRAAEFTTTNYEVYAGDVNADGYKDFYFRAKPFWMILYGEISTPIPLRPNADVFVSGTSGSYSSPVLSNLTDADFTNRVVTGNLVLAQNGADYYTWQGISSGQTNIFLRGVDSSFPALLMASYKATALPVITKIYLPSIYPNVSNRNYPVTLKDINYDGVLDLIVGSAAATLAYGGSENAWISDSAGIPMTLRELRPSIAAPAAPVNTYYVGSIEGHFRVDESGAATYTIPISIPDGVAGVRPQVALSYTSEGGNGIAGVGWSLSGLSAISRCRQTLSQDGVAKPLSWNPEDRFCYNGQRLMVVSGTYGAPSSVYRTEIDTFVRVTAVGGISGNPTYFIVEAKDGSTSYFGNTADSKMSTAFGTLTWAINRFSDSVGNSIDFNYEGDAATGQRIKEINYAFPSTNYLSGSAAQRTDGAAKISFAYQNRPDVSTSYLNGGYSFSQIKRLSSIKVTNNLLEVRSYYLAYLVPGISDPILNARNWNQQSRLSSLTECKGTSCFKPTQFNWGQGNNIISATYPSQTDESVPLAVAQNGFSMLTQAMGDFNGDGKPDIAYLTYNPTGNKTWLNVKYSGSNVIDSYPIADTPNKARLVAVDYNADARQDLFFYDGSQWKVFLSTVRNNGSWGITSDWLVISLPYANENAEFVDVDGDGLTDVMVDGTLGYYPLVRDASKLITSNTFYKFDSTLRSLSYDSSTFKNFGNVSSSSSAGNSNCFSHTYSMTLIPTSIADFNGDGVADFLVNFKDTINYTCNYIPGGSSTTTIFAAINQGGVLIPYASIGNVNGQSFTGKNFYVADLNGDGLSDLVKFDGVYQNTGAGFAFSSLPTGIVANSIPRLQLMDLNTDGLVDIVWYDKDGLKIKALINGESSVREIASTAVDNSGFIFSNTYPSDSSDYLLMDTDLDGVPDIVRFAQDSVRVTYGRAAAASFDQITKTIATSSINVIDNGMGNVTTIAYGNLASSGKYKSMQIDFTAGTPVNCSGLTPQEAYWRCMAVAKTSQSYPDASSFYSRLNGGWVLPDDSVVLQPNNTFSNLNSSKIAPVMEINGGMQVVSYVKSTAPTAVASTFVQVDYFYGEAKVQARGRGFLGFGYLKTVDQQTGVMTLNTYRQDFPFIGSPLSTLVYKSDNLSAPLLSSSANKLNAKKDPAANIFQPYVETAIQQSFSLNAATLLQTTTTTSTLDDYGNPLTISVVSQGADPLVSGNNLQTTKLTTNTYGSSADEGRLGRLSLSVVKTSLNGQPDTSRSASFTYYTAGNLKGLLNSEKVAESGLLTTYEYDQFGNKIKVHTAGLNALGANETRTVANIYSGDGRYLVSSVNDLGFATTVNNRNEFGEVTSSSDINGVGTKIYYNDMGTEYMRTDSTGAWSRTESNLCGGSVSCVAGAIYRVDTRVAGGGQSTKYYDALGRPIKEMALHFSGQNVVVDTQYDVLGRVVSKTEPYFEGSLPAFSTAFTYDILGRITKVVAPDGSITTSNYSDYTTTVTNSLNQVRVETRNGLGQLAQIQDQLGGRIAYSYNTNGDLLTVTTKKDANDAGVSIRLCYDLLGRKISMLDPDKGGRGAASLNCPDPASVTNTTVPVRAGWWTYQYDDFNELKQQTDAKGQRVDFTYDITGRMLTRADRKADASLDLYTRWYYDTNVDGSAATGAKGKVTTIISNTDQSNNCSQNSRCTYYVYDDATRLVQTTEFYPQDSTGYTSTNYYDEFGRLYEQRDPLQGPVLGVSGTQTHFNSYGYAYENIDLNDGALIRRTLSINARGQITNELRGNGVQSTAVYDPATGLLKQQQASLNGGSSYVQNNIYEWDSVGNLKSRAHLSAKIGSTVSLINSKHLIETFCYDGLNRLVKTNNASNDSSNTPTPVCGGTPDVTYDGYGNITSKSGVGSYTYGNNAGPHAVTSTSDGGTYTYDLNGNQTFATFTDPVMKSARGHFMDYTSYDLVKSIKKISGSNLADETNKTEFYYGADRARWKRIDTKNGVVTATTYIGNIERIQLTNGDIEWKRYVGGAVFTYKTNASYQLTAGPDKRYIYNDHLGSVDVITDAVGSVTHSESFDPWGERRSGEDWSAMSDSQINSALALAGGTYSRPITTRGFTGHEMVDDMHIIHMNGRIYDSRLGRFLQADPHVDGAKNTQGYNRYSYVRNNPLNATDPSGFFSLRKSIGLIITVIATIICEGTCTAAVWAAVGAGAGAAQAAANGGNILVGAVIGAFSGVVGGGGGWQGFLARGVVGGVSSGLMGGKFGNGFISAGLGGAFGGTGSYFGDLVQSAIVGGTVSVMTGGKFASGAQSAAISFLVMTGAKQIHDGGSFLGERRHDGNGDPIPDQVSDKVNKHSNFHIRRGPNGEIIFDLTASNSELAPVDNDVLNTYIKNGTSEWAKKGVMINIQIAAPGSKEAAFADIIFVAGAGDDAGFVEDGKFVHVSSQHVGQTATHELGHALGLLHQPNETGSIMSYRFSKGRSVLDEDVTRLKNCYFDNNCRGAK